MKKVLFLSQEFTPVSNGTVTCLENIMSLVGKEYDIVMYTMQAKIQSPQLEKIYNIIVKRPYNKADVMILKKRCLKQKVAQNIKSELLKQIVCMIINIIYFVPQRISNRTGFLNRQSWERNIVKYVEMHEKIQGYDILLSVGQPFSNTRAALRMKIKNGHLKWICMLFDLYTFNPGDIIKPGDEKNMKKRLEEENQWYLHADKIIILEEAYSVIQKCSLSKWKKKIIPLPTPSLLVKSKVHQERNERGIHRRAFINGSGIHLMYAGALYDEIRNPRISLEIMLHLCKKNPNICIHFLGNGCEDILCEYKTMLQEQLVIHGQLERDVVVDLLQEADILWNISNATTTQSPSKIMEYIGTGKPIVNIFSITEDVCVKLLERYPLAISIYGIESELNEKAEAIYQFIMKNKGEQYDTNVVQELYYRYSPAYFASKLMACMRSN